MPLPLVLAGPILRRVEPNLVSVWIALSGQASVTITLWEGRTKAGAVDPLIRSDPPTSTMRFGGRLHVGMALLRIPDASDKTLKPGVVYSYDLEIAVGATKHTLGSLGLLKSVATSNGGPAELARAHLALGYVEDFLPSFSLPPDTLENLRLVYGSCRRPANEHPDAMAWIDDLIADGKLFEDALKRPHQLVLGGDQIYADDVSAAHMHMANLLGNELIGTIEDPDAGMRPHPLPIERVTVDQRRLTGADEDPANHPDGWAPGGSTALPAGLAEFPAGRRRQTMLREAQMTTEDGESHLFSFGEFAAMYVMVWCNACWPWPPVADPPLPEPATTDPPPPPPWPRKQWPTARDLLAPVGVAPRIVAPEILPPKDWDNLTAKDVGKEEDDEEYDECEALKKKLKEKCGEECKDKAKPDPAKEPEVLACLQKERKNLLLERHAARIDQLARFVGALPKVRRTLANVPTYMIFDDHDVTDDWNLNPIWVDRVNTTSLGRAIIRNALASYAVFQDWGNDPLRYLNERNEVGPAAEPKRLLETITQMFPGGATEGPSKDVMEKLDTLFGLDQRPKPTVDGDVEAVNPPVKWHFSVPGPKHLLVAVDNRTRRSFVTRQGPPGNVAVTGLADQIPETLSAGRELLIVVAPLQVIGPALLDELIAPAAYRVFDAKGYDNLHVSHDEEVEDRELHRKAIGMRRMAGTNPDAIEAWVFDSNVFETLLARLAKHRRVLLLSGDVHYTAATALSYWTKGDDVPARMVQFTGSGFKNVMPWYIGTVDRVLSFAQRMVRADVGAERMGWNKAAGDAFVLTGGRTLADVPPVLRRRLHESPMLMPTFGWPEGTRVAPDKLPDWSWRSKPVVDLRPDGERPPPMQPRSLEPDLERIEKILTLKAEPGKELAAYLAIAARHQDQFDRLRHSRQILFRANFGLVRFEREAGLTAVHEVYTGLADPAAPADAEVKPLPYMIQKASLDGRADEVRPELAPFRPPAF
jgi:hypothetical protein